MPDRTGSGVYRGRLPGLTVSAFSQTKLVFIWTDIGNVKEISSFSCLSKKNIAYLNTLETIIEASTGYKTRCDKAIRG